MDAVAEREDRATLPGDRLPPARLSTVYRPETPVNLRLTLAPLSRGARGPTCLIGESGAWLTMRGPAGAATIRLTSQRGEVHATVWGDDAEAAEWALDRVPRLLGSGDDWSGLDVSGVPLLADARRRLPGLRLLNTGLVLEALIPAIIEQKVTSVEAWRAWRQLVTRYGGRPPGPAPEALRVFPSAADWRRIPSWEWHRAGVDPKRARTVLTVANLSDGLERSGGLDSVAASDRLQTVPGVGPWTAAETVQRSHGDPDTVSVGDYNFPAIVGWALAGKPVDDDGMLELLEPWRGHRQRVLRLIMASGFRKPRFGPRITIQDHRWH